MNNAKKQKETRQRVIALLTRQEIEFLDKLGMDALFSCGSKLTRTKIISYMVDILIRLGIDGKEIKTSYDLEEKIKGAIMKTLITQSLSTNGETVKKEAPRIEEELKKVDKLEQEFNNTSAPKINIEKKNGKLN